ncbi:PBS lyase [Planomonospora sphaerica]|uniref:PBS lyase n=1 Tax=Planomonospora sphaerica TaxID=161355 RepID=A0A161L9V0_9ACTN|nr:hypothetical protein [Planomonospora sphaerica]GAT64374.1 PBS lyase [Planomonospora sphaerica]
MLGSLDEVPWDRLEHNRGTASDVPALLRALTREQEAADALEELEDTLFHQGGWICPAAAAAVPFLAGLAAGPDVPGRAEIVMLLAEFAHEAKALGGRGVDPAWPAAWATAVAGLVRLLGDGDVLVRRNAAYALAAADAHAEAVLDALIARFPAEDDLTARLGLVLAAGEVTGHAPSDWLTSLQHHAEPQVRLAAARALGRVRADLDLVIDAIALGDLSPWRDSPFSGAVPESVIGRVARELGTDRPAQIRFATAMLAHSDPAYQAGAIKVIAGLASTSRSALTELDPLLPRGLDSPSGTVRAFAVHLVAASGSADRHRERLADLLSDRTLLSRHGDLRIGDLAVWALAWADDRRALPGLLDRMAGRWLQSPPAATHYSESPYMLDPPGLGELLARLDRWSGAVLPVVRATLRRTGHHEARRALVQALEAWGPAAAPAVPELTTLLRTDIRPWAATTLGAIGPAAAPAARHLRGLLRKDTSPPRPPLRIAERVDAAWALWRVTGDADAVLDVLGETAQADLNHRIVRRLADLGPAAAHHLDALRRSLTSTDDWQRAEAAHALWRITADPTDAVPVLAQIIEPLAEGRTRPVMRTATRYLAEIGPSATAAVPTLRTALAGDRRLNYFGGWRAFDEDREQHDLARHALRRITAAEIRRA